MPFRRAPKPGEPDYKEMPKMLDVAMRILGIASVAFIIYAIVFLA